MRVALIDPSLFTLPYDRALLGGLVQGGHEAVLFARKPGRDDNDLGDVPLRPLFYRLADSAAGRGLPGPLRLPLKGLDHAVSMMALRRALQRWRPGVIHFQWLALPMVDRAFLPALRRIAPLVLTVHDTNPFNGDPSASIQARGFLDGLSAFDRLIVHTEQGRARLVAAGLPAERLAVLPHGPLTALPAPVPNPMTGPLTFLLFGKIKPYKGLDLLLSAFAALPPMLRSQARLRVVGKPYMDLGPIHAQADRLGITDRLEIEPRFVADDEVDALFGPGTVAVFPYREIEASGVLSIALAHACPVIASALGNFAEGVRDGVDGVLVETGDVPALTAALARMISDREFAASCSRSARQGAEAGPGWVDIAGQTAALYQALPRATAGS
ncbi:MAG: glycosyltransferase [Janthinobacterium lividum]